MTATTPSTGFASQQAARDGFAEAERRRTQLIRVAEEITAIAEQLGLGALADGVRTTAERVRSDAFVVTVLGDFNTGKSTVLNALLGADTLPTKYVECTAILTEVRWADTPTAYLYPRTPDGGVADKPEQTPVDRLEEAIVVPVDDPSWQSPYAYAEVHWPLPLCRNNVVLVDSPGLNADPLREELTMSYLARTDAVVFLFDAQKTMAANEVAFMQANLESHDPFFVFNKINFIPTRDHDAVMRAAAARLRKARPEHPGDERRMIWVNALGGMEARTTGDLQTWESSGMAALERALETFLTTERHKVKILVPARSLKLLRRDIAASLVKQTRMLTEDIGELARRYEEAQVPLERLEHDAKRISDDLANRLDDLQSFVQDRVRAQLVELSGTVAELAVGSVPDNRLSIKPWKTKEHAEALAAEVAALTAREVETALHGWIQATLQPELDVRIAAIASALNQQVEGFEHDLDEMRLDMSGVAAVGPVAVDEDETPISRLLAGVGGFMLAGPAAGLAGLRFGPREMAKSLLPTLAIGLVWLFTPFGLPVLVAGLVAQALFGSVITLRGAEKKIKKQVGEELAREMRARAYENAQAAATRFGEQLDGFRTAIAAGFDTQLATFREEVETVLAAKRQGEESAARRRDELARLGDRLEEAMNQLDDIVDEVAGL